MGTALSPISVHRTAGTGRQWQLVDSADGWLWLARALAAKVMFPALPHAHAHCRYASADTAECRSQGGIQHMKNSRSQPTGSPPVRGAGRPPIFLRNGTPQSRTSTLRPSLTCPTTSRRLSSRRSEFAAARQPMNHFLDLLGPMGMRQQAFDHIGAHRGHDRRFGG